MVISDAYTPRPGTRGPLHRPYDMTQWNKEELLEEIEVRSDWHRLARERIQSLERQLKAARTRIRNLTKRR